MAGLWAAVIPRIPCRLSLSAVVLAASLSAAQPVLAEKTYFAESYLTEITIAGNGDLHIRETVRIRFEGGEFRYFFRGLPTERTDGIEVIWSSDSAMLKRRRRLVEVMWRFDGVRDTTRTFVVEYKALGAARIDDDRSTLHWNLFPYDRPYRIEHAEAWLQWSPDLPDPAGVETDPVQARIDHVDRGVRIGPERLRPETTVRVRAAWKDILPHASAPSWQLHELARHSRIPHILALAGAILLGGLVMLMRVWRMGMARLSRGASASLGGKPPVISQPPETIPAALAGALVHGNAWTSQIVAILFDLGRAGSLRFAKESKSSKKKGKPPDLHKLDVPPATPWESALMCSIFDRVGHGEPVKWAEAQKRLLKSQSACRRVIMEELERRGEIDPRGRESRRRMGTGAAILLLAGLAFVLLNIVLIGWAGIAGFAVAGALLLLAAAAGIASRIFPLWTHTGRERARRWKGFGEYLKQAAGGKTPLDTERFISWLPYAVSLGVADKWTRAGKRWGIPAPPWLPRLENGSWDTGATLAVVTSTLTAGGGSASGGAGGAGGGGSSGAG